jgi:large subunit ribosomal protein L21
MPIVIQSGNKQYIVEPGQKILVDRLPAPENSEVELEVVYSYGNQTVQNLKAKVLAHCKGKKIRVVKYKPKSNYHRQYGFRPHQTLLEIL